MLEGLLDGGRGSGCGGDAGEGLGGAVGFDAAFGGGWGDFGVFLTGGAGAGGLCGCEGGGGGGVLAGSAGRDREEFVKGQYLCWLGMALETAMWWDTDSRFAALPACVSVRVNPFGILRSLDIPFWPSWKMGAPGW